jgi:hypothetical protein
MVWIQESDQCRTKNPFGLIVIGIMLTLVTGCGHPKHKADLWSLYEKELRHCKYVDLTHAFNPTIAVWPGFGSAFFKPSVAGANMHREAIQNIDYELSPQLAAGYHVGFTALRR